MIGGGDGEELFLGQADRASAPGLRRQSDRRASFTLAKIHQDRACDLNCRCWLALLARSNVGDGAGCGVHLTNAEPFERLLDSLLAQFHLRCLWLRVQVLTVVEQIRVAPLKLFAGYLTNHVCLCLS